MGGDYVCFFGGDQNVLVCTCGVGWGRWFRRPKPSHYRYLSHWCAPSRARRGYFLTLDELSVPYCFQSLSYSCPHALTGNHVFRGGTAEAPSRAQRVVRGHHTAGPPKSNPFANQNPHYCWFVRYGQQPFNTGHTDLSLLIINSGVIRVN